MRTGSPLVVTKDRLTRVLACEAHYVASEFGDRPLSAALACGAIVDVLFRQLVTVGSIGDPMADGLAALAVDDHQRRPGLVGRASAGRRAGRTPGRGRAPGRRAPASVAGLGPGLAPADAGGHAGAVGRRCRRAVRPGRPGHRTTGPRRGLGGHHRGQVGLPPHRAPRRPPLLRPDRGPAEPGATLRGRHLLHHGPANSTWIR